MQHLILNKNIASLIRNICKLYIFCFVHFNVENKLNISKVK